MDLKSHYLEQIQSCAPDLFYQDAVLNDSGQFNDVLVLDNEWIFRFPRYAEGVRSLAYEADLLQALRGQLPLPVPDFIYRRLDTPEPGLAFVGYKMLPGRPFYPSEIKKIRDYEAREAIAEQLAGFLRSLHAIAPESLGLTLHSGDAVEEWSRFYAEIREKLFPAMRADAQALVARHFEAYLGSEALQYFTPCLRHGDFGGSNILFDPRRLAITGVIDFSSCALGDPAADLASASTLGASFFNLLVARYEPDEVSREPLLARVRFYRGTFALQEALEGYNNHDSRAFEAGMEKYI